MSVGRCFRRLELRVRTTLEAEQMRNEQIKKLYLNAEFASHTKVKKKKNTGRETG